MTDEERRDIALARRALAGGIPGVDRQAGAVAFERLVRRFFRSEDDTKEVPTPEETSR